LIEFETVIVAAGVIAVAEQSFRRKPFLPEPVAERDLVERRRFRIARTGGDRQNEGAFSFRVAPVYPEIELFLKCLKLTPVFYGR
jgi:hypothetical protein